MSKKKKILKRKQIIIALDYDSSNEANSIANLLDPEIYRVKIGKQLFASEGPRIIENFNKQGFDIFLDLKLHDIPNTVYKALKNLLKYEIWMTNIHLLGGEEMIQAAREARESIKSKALLIGVSVLTSLSEKNIKNMGFDLQIPELVNNLSMSAKQNNIDGVVCSAKEVSEIKKNFGKDFITVTPGIRIQQKKNDQSRVATLEEAIKIGSDYIVLGREITASKNMSKMIKEVESYII
jgi:orotidine-5'-phosphate decarboxylase